MTATTSASIAIFNAASSIDATGSGSIGIFASADENIAINDGANTSVSGDKIGIEAFEADSTIADIEINVGPNATIDATTSNGIWAINSGVGDISVRTDATDIIKWGSAGIDAVNQAAPTSATSDGSVKTYLLRRGRAETCFYRLLTTKWLLAGALLRPAYRLHSRRLN